MNLRGSEREAVHLTDPDIAGIQPAGSLITSPKPTRSRRWFVLTLALAGCNQAAAASPYRLLLPRADRNFGDGTPIPTATPTAITPDRTPTPTATPTRTSTPEPTATPDTRPSTPWPAEMAQQLTELTVLDEDKLRFGYYTDRSQIPYPDIYAMFTGDGSGNADVPRRMVHVLATDRVQREWFVLIVGHERSHFHQAEQSRLNGMDPDARPNFQQSYLNTAEGREFVAASNAAIEYARSHGIDITSPFMHNPFGADNYEDAADVMSYWFNRRSALDGEVWSSVRDWATKWLHR